MSRYSTPELEQQAIDLNTQIIDGLVAMGILAELNDSSGGVKIPEYHYDILRVDEKSSGHGFSHRRSSELEVYFSCIHIGRGCLCHAKRFKADTKDLLKKVLASVKERRDTVIAQRARDEEVDQARTAHQRVLKKLSTDYPDFKGNIENSNGSIHLSFRHLSDAEARAIFKALQDAGIKGDPGFVLEQW